MPVCLRGSAADPLSRRHIEEMTQERAVFVDRATVHRGVIKILQFPAAVFHRHKRPGGSIWRTDEPSIKVGGEWKHQYRVVDRADRCGTAAIPN